MTVLSSPSQHNTFKRQRKTDESNSYSVARETPELQVHACTSGVILCHLQVSNDKMHTSGSGFFASSANGL